MEEHECTRVHLPSDTQEKVSFISYSVQFQHWRDLGAGPQWPLMGLVTPTGTDRLTIVHKIPEPKNLKYAKTICDTLHMH